MFDSKDGKKRFPETRDSRLALRLLRYLRPRKMQVTASLALMALSAPLVLAGPPLTQVAVDLYLAPDPSRQPAGLGLFIKQYADLTGFGGSRQQGVIFIALVFLLANLGAFFTQYAQWMLIETLGQNIMHDIRAEIFLHFQRVSIGFYERNPVGRLITRLTSDVDALNEIFTSGVIGVLVNCVTVVYVVAWMFWVSWRLALVSFAVLPLLALLTIWFRRGARSAFSQVRTQIASINAFLNERLAGMHAIQLFGGEAAQANAFDQMNKAHRKANMDALFYHNLFYPGIELFGAVAVSLIIWYGGGRVIREALTIGTLIAFVQLVIAFFEPISSIGERYNILQAALAASEPIFALLDEPVTADSLDEPARVWEKARGRIEFRHVWFAYSGEDWVLEDVSFVVEPGQKVAVIGHTGAGKTTIAGLLLRFYEIQRGRILLDDVDIRQMDLQQLRSNFSIVPQDVALFSGDVSSNIRLHDRSITDEQVSSAAREVRADEFIEKTAGGYQSRIFERGAGLSAGQKQLIGFARALAFNRSILILDEATSSVDAETEALIHDALERLMAGRTSLVIAHRLSTIQSADNIVVLHKGQVREMGNHQALLSQRGLYWKLYRLQFSSAGFNRSGLEAGGDD